MYLLHYVFILFQTSDYLGLLFHLYEEQEVYALIQTDEEVKLLEAKKVAEK